MKVFTLVSLLLPLVVGSLFAVEALDAEGDPSLRLSCILGKSHTTTACPQDGGWGSWGAWGSCEGRCGSVGRRERRRACDNPIPARHGEPCSGSDSQTDTCSLPGCQVEAYELLVAGDKLRAQQLELVKVVHARFPALASKCFLATCRWELVQRVLEEGAVSYWIALHCVKHNIGCPVRGGWSAWSDWSACSARCGSGNRTRRRDCSAPQPAAPNLRCAGSSFHTRQCRAVACAENLDGCWSEWSAWSECSASCGDGVKRRKRRCQPGGTESGKSEAARHCPRSASDSPAAEEMARKLARSVDADNRCTGPEFELAPCQSRPCDVDGGWSDWEEWSACSVSCGLGSQLRSRSCSRPAQTGEGRVCAGAVTETQRCFKRPCSSLQHQVALFTGGGRLEYDSPRTGHALLHLHVRFLAQRPTGRLAQRNAAAAAVSLRLVAGWLVLEVNIAGCKATVVAPHKLELHEWHDVMAVVMGRRIALRVDDATEHSVGRLSCVPPRPRLDAPTVVGRDFCGLVQFVAVNFRALALRRGTQVREGEQTLEPAASSNIEVSLANDIEEGFRALRKGDLMSTPCPGSDGPWKVEMAVRCDSDGLLLLVPGERKARHAAVTLFNGRVALATADQAPALADAEVAHGDWILLEVDRAGTVVEGKCCMGPCDLGLRVNGGERVALPGAHVCVGEMFIGGVPIAFQSKGPCVSVLEPLEGVLGWLEVCGDRRDLAEMPGAQLSGRLLASRSLCTAATYVESTASPPHGANLSVTYSATAAAASVYWLRLDTVLNGSNPREEGVEACDDGRVARLHIKPSEHRETIEGFYLVWLERESGDRVLTALGVVAQPSDLTEVVGAGMLALGMAAALLATLYLLFIAICCCCPAPLDAECKCSPAAFPDPVPCLTTRRKESTSCIPCEGRKERFCSRKMLPLVQRQRAIAGSGPGRHARFADEQPRSDSSQSPHSDSQPSLPSPPSSRLNGSDIQCEMKWSNPNCRDPIPVSGVHFEAPNTVTLVVDRCVYSE